MGLPVHAELGQDSAQGDAGDDDLVVEGHVAGEGDEVGQLLRLQGGGAKAVGAAVLVAGRGSGAGVASGMGGA